MHNEERQPLVARARTSAAAVFALVFGLLSLFCALTLILSPIAVVFALLGIILGALGLRAARKPGVTGKGVALGGLVLAVIGLLLGVALTAGITTFLSDEQNLDRIQGRLDAFRRGVTSEVRSELPSP